MTREEKIEVFIMKLDGETFERIAKLKGFTKQHIHQELNSIVNPYKSRIRSIYPNLNEWMFKNDTNARRISELLRISPSTALNKLHGRTQFKLNEIAKLVDLTGIESSKLFSKGDN